MSVKVAVRVRPFNERERNLGTVCCIKMDGPRTIITPPSDHPRAAGDALARGGERTFTFDYSFWSHDDFEFNDQ